ncbi:MAG: hypothetical protein V1878_00440 [bacterium]
MMKSAKSTFSIAVFPFLKTSGPVVLGGVTFRSTDDVSGLPSIQAAAVSEVASMLFLQNDLRLKSASYAVAPLIDLTYSNPDVGNLADIQAVVAYLYASPHKVFGHPFMTSEHASMVVFVPGRVSSSLVQPDYHVESVGEGAAVEPDEFDDVPGYAGLYNFRHHFWVTRGSRVYGPEPHLTLNYTQDLCFDVQMACSASTGGYALLLKVLDEPTSVNSMRVLTAIRWFNDANREGRNEAASLVSLAIAFESLLGLPQTEKTDRLVDAIALLLGRVVRLDVWADQFYRARSSIVHEGRAERLHFIAADTSKGVKGPTYQSLISYGIRIFRLCLSTLLVGSDLARQAGLEDILVTNEQRFQRTYKTLADTNVSPGERIDRIEEIVEALDRYRFLSESGLRLDTMVGAVRLAVEALVESDESLPVGNGAALRDRIAGTRAKDPLEQLEAIHGLDTLLAAGEFEETARHGQTVRKLVEVVWGYLFSHYYWLKQQKDIEKPRAQGDA